jgi:uncharacterized repeat protein (TIGR01451 family)
MPVNPSPPGAEPMLSGQSAPPVEPQQQPGTKPLPFKLVDVPPMSGTTSGLKPLPATGGEPLPPGSVATPCLTLQRTGPTSVKAEQPFSYQITVRNAGTVSAVQALLEEILPAGTRYVGGQPLAQNQGNRLVWNLENMAPGAERRFRVEVETARDGPWKAQANLTASVSSDLQTNVMAVPVQMLKVSAPASVPVGHPVAFTIRVTNTMAVPMPDTVLRVLMSPGLQHLQGDAIEASFELPAGKSRDLNLEAVAQQTGRPSVDVILLSNQKVVASSHITVTILEQPLLGLKQSGSLTPPANTQQDFQLEVVNRGAAELRDIVITDVLPEGWEFVTAADGSYDGPSRTIRWTIAALAGGQTRQVVFRALVRNPGAQVNRVSAGRPGAEALLHTILRVTNAP